MAGSRALRCVVAPVLAFVCLLLGRETTAGADASTDLAGSAVAAIAIREAGSVSVPGMPFPGDDPNWQVLLEEGFEGPFPSGDWRAYRRGEVPYRWEEESFRARTGDRSAWCVGWSENELEYPQLDPASDLYPEDVETWMVWGPFDASDAESAFLDFWVDLDVAPGDSLFYGASLDNDFFYGYFETGETASYVQRSMDVRVALGIPNLLGRDEIYIAFVFFSDGAPGSGRGVFLDDVVVRKRVPGPVCRLDRDAIDFGRVPVDSTRLGSVTLFNDGDRDLTGSVSLSCPDFTLDGDPAFRIAPLDSEQIQLRFAPTREGDSRCTVWFTGTTCDSLELQGEGLVYQLPVPSHEVPAPTAAGQSVELALRLQQFGEPPPGPRYGTVRYLRDTAEGPAWATLEMSALGEDALATTIPAVDVSLLGSRYYFEYGQGELSARLPATAPDSSFSLVTFSSRSLPTEPLPGGSEVTGYRMVSIPGVIGDRSVSALLEDDFGEYEDTQWRLFRFESGRYTEYPEAPADQIEPGEAVWVLHRTAGQRFDAGPIQSWPLGSFEIELQPGWNDIGLPFAAVLPLGAVDAPGVDGPYTYEAGWRTPISITQLEPWAGYSYFNPGSSNSILRLEPLPDDPEALATDGAATPSGSATWSLSVEARSGEAADPENVLGIARDATREKDPQDLMEPRLVADGVRLGFLSSAGSDKPDGELWCSDFRSDRAPLSVWEVAIESAVFGPRGEPAPVSLTWQPLGSLPEGWVARLVEPLSGRTYDGAIPGGLTLLPPFGRLEVFVGSRSHVESRLGGSASAIGWSAELIGPNPFRFGSRLRLELPEASEAWMRVFDASGRCVLSASRGTLLPGRYLLEWDGTNGQGRAVPSGVYFWEVDLGGRRFRERVAKVR